MRITEVVVVHHRTPGVLRDCLARLARHAADVPVRVLDTAPEATTAQLVREAHPGARLVPTANRSYAAAVNEAFVDAAGPLIAVMNADVFVEAGTLAAMAAPFHDPDVAAVGPLVRTPDGRLQDQGAPYAWATAQVRGRGPHVARDVAWLSGCLFAARLEAVRDAGGMDGTLRFGNEDLDWCLRLRSAGWRCRIVGAEVLHLGGSSTPDAARFLVEGLRGGMIVARRHHGPVRAAAQRAAVWAWAATLARLGPLRRRAGWSAVERMMRRGAFDVSPFGVSLADDAPGFPARWPPQAPREQPAERPGVGPDVQTGEHTGGQAGARQHAEAREDGAPR